jgi:hypothetical protein
MKASKKTPRKSKASRSIPKPAGYWDDFVNVEGELRSFIAEHGQAGIMPTKRALQGAGQNSLVSAIAKHGGILSVAERLNLNRPGAHKPLGYWNDFAHVEQEIHAFIVEHEITGMMPSGSQLLVAGRDDLKTAISKHGGFSAVAAQMGLNISNIRKLN